MLSIERRRAALAWFLEWYFWLQSKWIDLMIGVWIYYYTWARSRSILFASIKVNGINFDVTAFIVVFYMYICNASPYRMQCWIRDWTGQEANKIKIICHDAVYKLYLNDDKWRVLPTSLKGIDRDDIPECDIRHII